VDHPEGIFLFNFLLCMSLFFLFAAQMSTMMAIVDIGLSMYSQKRLSAMMVDWALASTMEECVEGSDSFAVT
jgi:hypothetical protein